MKNYILYLTFFAFLFLSSETFAAVTAESFMSRNVSPIDKSYSYKDDWDDSLFRLKVYKSSAKKIAVLLQKNKSNLCEIATSGAKFDFRTSSSYIVSVLKKAGAIASDDKNYAFKSAHFMWEYYLTYRKFVDVSRSFKKMDAFKLFDKLPEGYIVLVQKQCVPNGAVALKCKKGMYTKRFPNFQKLKERLNNAAYPKCKIGKGLKIIVEAERLRELI